uniref:Uncharacterized protein n=1 Tax=Fundidesulfovibrio putealis TaxID=270496 RepID=A0A7C4EKK5_9BACT
MEEGYNFKVLQQNILALSHAAEWQIARKEWHLVGITESEEPETCLCGHYPIIELCTIKNIVTSNVADVGNRCVKRFLGLDSDKIFTALKRIRKDPTKSLNADSIVFFKGTRTITSWEYDFLTNTQGKRKLSSRQLETRININNKILASVARRGTNL